MVFITHVRMQASGSGHEHIQAVKWKDPMGKTGESTVTQMIDFIENQQGTAKVSDGTKTVEVAVVDASPKYLRTYADGKWTNNLLALPRF